LRTVHQYNEYFTIRGLLITALYIILAIIYGLAWWTVWKRKPSGRGWGIAASLIYIPVSLWGIIFFAQPFWGFEGVAMAVGIAGLVAFLWCSKIEPDANYTEPNNNHS
jgi:predicted permease